MLSGAQTLQQLDQGLSSVRAEVNRIDHELNQVSLALHANRHAQAQSLQELAKIRLDELSGKTFTGELEAADQRALTLLEERRQAWERLENDIAAAMQALVELENERVAQQAIVSDRARAIIDCEHRIQGELEEDADYQKQLRVARELDSIAAGAEQKAEQAEQDKQEKGRPYEESELFMYLWRRKYGTPDYEAGPLTRYLDRRVESLCDYDEYRVNYWTLLEIPRRLQSHAEAARSHSETALETLAALETAKAQRRVCRPCRTPMPGRRQDLDAIDDRHRAAGRGAQSAVQTTHRVRRGQGYLYDAESAGDERCPGKRACSNSMTRRIKPSVSRTIVWCGSSPNCANSTETLRKSCVIIAACMKQNSPGCRNSSSYVVGSSYVVSMTSVPGFGNEGLITAMLGQFLTGLVSSNELWRVLERHQRHRDVGAWPDFGSGGLGRPRSRRSPWHFPRGRGGLPGGFRLPRSGGWRSRGGGGFRTGGGF